MAEPVTIVGQGLAGSLLAWTLGKAGVDVAIVDAGPATAASRVGAGLITPVTGRRWVKTWGVDAWLDPALALYREIEDVVGVPLVRRLRVRRRFRDEADREMLAAKVTRGELAPYVTAWDDDGAWIEGAAQVDTAALIATLRRRWREAGCLREATISPEALRRGGAMTVLCGGAGTLDAFAFVPWELAWGEIVEGGLAGLEPDVVLNRGHWVLPMTGGRARVGATYERAEHPAPREPSAAAREELAHSAYELTGQRLTVTGQDGGWRVTVPDRRPCVGVHPEQPDLGLIGALGSKGTLWAPALAQAWAAYLCGATPFAAEVEVGRFWTAPQSD